MIRPGHMNRTPWPGQSWLRQHYKLQYITTSSAFTIVMKKNNMENKFGRLMDGIRIYKAGLWCSLWSLAGSVQSRLLRPYVCQLGGSWLWISERVKSQHTACTVVGQKMEQVLFKPPEWRLMWLSLKHKYIKSQPRLEITISHGQKINNMHALLRITYAYWYSNPKPYITLHDYLQQPRQRMGQVIDKWDTVAHYSMSHSAPHVSGDIITENVATCMYHLSLGLLMWWAWIFMIKKRANETVTSQAL